MTVSWSVLFVLSLALQYMAFAAAPSALAVHDEGLFELDGNAVSSAAVAGDDWDKVFNGTSSADATAFVTDKTNSNSDDIFTGGSSKDDNNVTDWLWTTSKPQAKNDIAHAYAAAYTSQKAGDTFGDTIVYFGLDKFDASGDNFVGFWFLQGQVGPTGNGNPPGSPFSGAHKAGDVLVLADYTNGGAVSAFSVYKWAPNCSGADCAPNANNLRVVASGVPCTNAGATDVACADTNGSTETAPWPFLNKSGDTNFLPAEFFEGGIDLTKLGLDTGCFTSFIAETRSSQAIDATLSDFAGGTFSFCSAPDISTQVKHNGTSTGSNGHITIGDSVTDTATLTGSKGTVQGTVVFSVCGPSASTPDCSSGGTKVGATKTLSSGSATSDAFTPDAVGSYCFRVDFTPAEGSKYLPASHTNTTTECFVVDKKTTSITTSADQSVSVGQTISDSATLSGATADAGGSIVFKAYGPNDANCSNAPVFTSSAVAVSGPDTYGPVSFTPAVAGTYHWIATYSGDAKNLGSHGDCGDTGENDTVTKVTPSIATQASADVTFGDGISDSLSDTATVSGGLNPSGTVTFKLYGPNDATCAGLPIFTSADRPLSSGTATSATFTPTLVGTYRWIATYNGDANNNSVSGACNDAGENVVVHPAHPSITTALVSGAQSGATISIALGESAHDTSSLSGATANAGGTVHYQVFTDTNCTTKFADAGTVPVVNGVPGDSTSIQFNNAGNYYWSADYSGDAANDPASSNCSLEIVSVGLNRPTISTNASESVVLGGSIHDTATLAAGFNPTGVITFRLYGPNDANCAGSAIFTSAIPVNGNGDYVSGSFTPAAAGSYRWIATYSGDANNAAVAGACNDANENVLVTVPNLHAEKLVSVNDGPFVHQSSALPGDTLTYHISITNSGNGAATNVPVSDDISALLAHATYNNDASNGGALDGSTLKWTIPSIAANGGSVTLSFSVTLDATFPVGTTDLPNTVVVTGPGSNCAAGSTDAACSTDTTVGTSTLGLTKSNDAPIQVIDLGNGQTADLPTAKEGATIGFTLTYTASGVGQTNGVLTDVLPKGLTYVDGSASNNAEFTFKSATKNADGTTTLEWDAAKVSQGGTVTYKAKVDAGAAGLAQPLVNTASIKTDQNGPDQAQSQVFVQAPPLELTPPPTDTFSQPTASSNPGFALMLILLGVAGLTLAIGFITPVPERVRRRDRLG